MKTRYCSYWPAFWMMAFAVWLPVESQGQNSSSESALRKVNIRVEAGETARPKGTPLICELPFAARDHRASTLFTKNAAGQEVGFHVQIVPGERAAASWLLERDLKAGEQREYELRSGIASNRMRTGPNFEENIDTIEINEIVETSRPALTSSSISAPAALRPILHYRKTPTSEAADFEPHYTRSGYIHPLLTPSGKEVTGDYPADHPHQHGLFFAWTNCTFEGRDINFWDQKAQTARIRHLPANDHQQVSGPAFTEFTVNQRHEILSALGGVAKTVLNETWQVRTWRPVGDFYLIDIVSTQTCASDSPLTINRYHYGGMAMRGTADWFINEKGAEQPGDFLTSEGKTRADGNHSRPKWVDMLGRYPDGTHAGVAVFDHPDNFRFPQWVRLHPSKPYFVFTPQVEDGFEIKPGEPYVSRYRYVVHDGPPDAELLDRLWNDYAHPPKATVIDGVE